ncbi:hypothetical protein D3C81_193390 [compost metagenome]|jgi:hypothetical protein
MKTADYFLLALNAGAYKKKAWVLSVFSILIDAKERREPYELIRTDKAIYFRDPVDLDNLVLIDDADVKRPLLGFRDKIAITPDLVPNLQAPITTTCGNLFFNFYVLIYALGKKIPYLEGRQTPKGVEGLIQPRLTSNPVNNGENYDPNDLNPIYVSEYKKFNKAMFGLMGFTQLCVPSATPRTMSTDPRIPEMRNKLLEKYAGRLNDPAVISLIDAELIKVDKEWMKNDPDGGDGFYVNPNKSYDVVRKKVFLMHGAEAGFKEGTDVDFIPNSLNEGWDIEKLPSMVNSLREGSYNRGRDTALGGEAVKFLGRVFQNTVIAEKDCGSNLGWQKRIDEENYKSYVGFYRITPQGPSLMDEAYLKGQIGKEVLMRTPMLCRTPKTGFCECCMGANNALNPTSLGLLAADVGSQIMGIFMGAMHGKSLKTAKYDFKTSIF